ncbi:hypothetical protein PFISCL1PPCAC_22722, partial [Pristionchus fissidentatus]
VEYFFSVISTITNSLLLFLIIRASQPTLGAYKYLLAIFATYDLFLTSQHILVDPKVHNFGSVFTIYSARYPDDPIPVAIYCAFFTVPFALTNINFLYRFWAVKSPEKLEKFRDSLFAFVLALYPIGEWVMW